MCPESNLRLKKGCNEHVSTYHKLLIMMILSRAIYCVWKSLLMTVYRCFDYHAVVKFHSNIYVEKGFSTKVRSSYGPPASFSDTFISGKNVVFSALKRQCFCQK